MISILPAGIITTRNISEWLNVEHYTQKRIFPQKFTQNYLEQSNDCEFEIITSDYPSLWFS